MRRLLTVLTTIPLVMGCGLFGGGGGAATTPQPQAQPAQDPGFQRPPPPGSGAAVQVPTTQPAEIPESLPVSGWVRVSQESTVPAGGVRQVRVTCPSGKRVFGGGGSGAVAMTQSYPASESEWTTVFVNETRLDLNVVAWAICANTGEASAASDLSPSP